MVKTKTEDVYIVFKKQYLEINRKNWTKIIINFLKLIEDWRGNKEEVRMVIGWLAALCQKAYEIVAYHKTEKERLKFNKTFLKLFQNTNRLLDNPGQIICGKKQPSFLETLKPTLDRYLVMESLDNNKNRSVIGLIIGGSMAYGPFFTIRHNKIFNDYSDIDGLLIIDDNWSKNDLISFFEKNKYIASNGKKEFALHLEYFFNLKNKKEAEVFSYRFDLYRRNYTMSLHFIPYAFFKDMVDVKMSNDLNKKNAGYFLKDYRMIDFNNPCFARHSFDRSRYESPIESYSIGTDKFISIIPSYTIEKGKFYPGFFQNVILPHFLVFHDRKNMVSKLVKNFKKNIFYLADNAKKNDKWANYAKAHNQYNLFMPGRYDEGFNSFVEPNKIIKYIQTLKKQNKKKYTKILEKNEKLVCHVVSEKLIQKEISKNKQKFLTKLDNDLKKFSKKTDQEIRNLFNKAKDKKEGWLAIAQIPENIIVCSREKSSNQQNEDTIFSEMINQFDIMSLDWYRILVLKYGKVYISNKKTFRGYNKKGFYKLIVKVR